MQLNTQILQGSAVTDFSKVTNFISASSALYFCMQHCYMKQDIRYKALSFLRRFANWINVLVTYLVTLFMIVIFLVHYYVRGMSVICYITYLSRTHHRMCHAHFSLCRMYCEMFKVIHYVAAPVWRWFEISVIPAPLSLV